jgi:hypothetical protein
MNKKLKSLERQRLSLLTMKAFGLEYTPERISKRDARVKPSTFLADRSTPFITLLLADFGYLTQEFPRHLQFLMGPIHHQSFYSVLRKLLQELKMDPGSQTGCNSMNDLR